MKHETYEKQFEAMFKRINKISELTVKIMKEMDPEDELTLKCVPDFAEIAGNLCGLWGELETLQNFNHLLAMDMIEMKKKLGLPLSALPLKGEMQH